jgi:hypothetical protein
MKPFIIISLLIFFAFTGNSQEQIIKFNPKIAFSKPDQNSWRVVSYEAPNEGNKGILMYKHLPILDSLGYSIEPVLAVLYENINEKVDVIEYSVSTLASKPYDIQRKLLGGYPAYSQDKHSVVFKGYYEREGIKHTVLLGYILYKKVGIEIIGDATSDVFNLVEKDFSIFLKSVHILD